ncbi:PRD domain protein [compost metagenome]
MVHIACCIEHMLEGGEMPINRNKQELMDTYPQMYLELKRNFAPLEHEFNVIFDDNELANILSIINSSANSRAI